MAEKPQANVDPKAFAEAFAQSVIDQLLPVGETYATARKQVAAIESQYPAIGGLYDSQLGIDATPVPEAPAETKRRAPGKNGLKYDSDLNTSDYVVAVLRREKGVMTTSQIGDEIKTVFKDAGKRIGDKQILGGIQGARRNGDIKTVKIPKDERETDEWAGYKLA